MLKRADFRAVFLVFATVALASCGGGGIVSPPTGPSLQSASHAPEDAAQTQSVDVRLGATPATVVLPLGSEMSGSLTLRSQNAAASVRVSVAGAPATDRAVALSRKTCPAIPPIVIVNPFPFPITITLEGFTLRVPCSIDGKLFGASSYQSQPVPQTLVTTKLGDATGTGHTVSFTPAATQLTFPARGAVTISILPELSTAYTQIPALPNVNTSLTTNVPALPNSLALTFPNVRGSALFQSACYLPSDQAGPGLAGVHVLGTPSFYCVLAPGETGTTTTFGGANPDDVVTFTLGPNAKPDRSLIQLDGPAVYAGCTPVTGGQTCDSPPFAIPVYSKAIVSNDAEIQTCVPLTENADCNGAAGNPTAPKAPSVRSGNEFQLLFADDPTYSSVNTFGGVTLQVLTSSACTIEPGSDENGDAPPGYSDPGTPTGSTPILADFAGVGPDVEFDIRAHAPGTCSINLTEDSGLKRSFAFGITVR